MKLSETAIEDAVIRIFRDDFVHAGGRLSMETLERAWHGVHLRRDELYQALQRLQAQGLVSMQDDADGVYAELTPAGDHRIGDLPGDPVEFARRLIDSLELGLSDRRHPSESGVA